MDSLTKASYDVMIKEDEGISAKMRQLLNAGLIKEKKDLPFFKSAMKKVKGGTITTVQERQVLLNVLGQFLTMVDEAPEFFNLMRRELAKSKNKKEEVEMVDEKLDPVGQEDGDVDNDGDKDSTDKYLMKRRKAIGKAMKKEDYANSMIKKDEGHKGDKKGGDKMQKLKKVREDYGFTSFKEFRNRKVDEAYGNPDDDQAMAAQKAQMPASLGGKHKDKSRPVSSTQVTKQKSQFHSKEEVETTDEAMLDPSKSKAARLFRQGQKQNDWRRQAKASELRDKANKARSKRIYDKKSPEEKQADADWSRERADQAKSSMEPDVRKSMAHSSGSHQMK